MSNRDWDIVADMVVDYINDKTRRSNNGLRDEYARMISSNHWKNRDFGDLVDAILNAMPNLEERYGRPRDRPEDILTAAIPDLIDGHFAYLCLANREVARELDNRTYDEMSDAAKLFKALIEGRRREPRYASSRDDRDYRRDDRSYGRQPDERRYSEQRSSYYSSSRRDDRSSGGNAAMGGAWAAVSSIGQKEEAPREQQRPPEREPVREPVREEPPRPKIDGPDFTKAQPYEDFWKDGEHWQVAHLSRWRLAGGENPITSVPALYDINKFIKYYVKDQDGVVREELEQVTDDTKYLAHQLMVDPTVVETRKSSGAVSLRAVREREEDPLLKTEVPEREKVPLAQMVQALSVPTEVDYNVDTGTIGCMYHSRNKLRASKERQRVDFHLIRTPIITTDWGQIGLIDEVYKSATLTQAAERLRDLKNRFDKAVWDTLNQRFSELVLRAVNYQFQNPGLRELSFANDWTKLLAWFEKKRGAAEVAEFAKRCSYIVTLACQYISREELPSIMEDLTDGNEHVPTVVFADFCAIASLDESIDGLGIGKQLEESKQGVAVTNQAYPDLVQGLRQFYQAAENRLPAPTKPRVYLSTSDNRLIEVIPFAARTQAFILAQA